VAPTDWAAAMFDLDGTLVDREPLMTAAVVEVMAATVTPVDEADAAGWVGRAWQDIHAELGVRHHLGWELHEWHARILTTADRLVGEGFALRELTGGAELIGWFHRHGVPVAVVTGSTHAEVEPVLDQLGVRAMVDVVVAAGDYDRGKPDPAPFLVAADVLGVDPACCVVFEDSDVGIAAARAAGMAVVATAEANASAGEPGHQRLDVADVVVPSLLEARLWLEGR
jgi:beta-phosphoglucomutase-like phosphatase (HAD superfamily)